MGKDIVQGIPADSEKYAAWLAEIRSEFEVKHIALEKYLCMKSFDGQVPQKNGRTTHDRPDLHYHDPDVDAADDRLPMYEPAELSAHIIEWQYILDLDREVFTINDSVHMKLNCIAREQWIPGIVKDFWEDHILLPGIVPKECLTGLVLTPELPSAEKLQLYENLGVLAVDAKGIRYTPPLQRHGPLLSSTIFQMFEQKHRWTIRAHLLGWNVDDLCFREIVYAILCIATPGKNLSLARSSRVLESPGAGYFDLLSYDQAVIAENGLGISRSESDSSTENTGDGSTEDAKQKDNTPSVCGHQVDSSDKFLVQTTPDNAEKQGDHDTDANPMTVGEVGRLDAEFVAHLGVGSHLKCNLPGSAPESSVY